jgi:hypothetical protein
VTGGCRKLQSEELHNLYSSPSIMMVFESRNMRWVARVARIGEMWNTGFQLKNLKEKEYFRILKCS